MVRVAVIDDEAKDSSLIRNYIQKYSKASGEELFVTVFSSGIDFVSDYSAIFDIIFLDIEMPYLDGIKTAKKIRKLDENVRIIFVTNMAQYAINGYEVSALDYIVKPVEYFCFAMKMDKAIRLVKRSNKSFILINTDTCIMRLDYSSIFYVEIMGHTAVFHVSGGEISTRMTMEFLEQTLTGGSFFRCNRCYIINLMYLDEIKNGDAIVSGQALKISRAKMPGLLSAMAAYCKDRG